MPKFNMPLYPTSTPNMKIIPEKIKIEPVTAGVLATYQKRMSKAIWRPAFGRKLGFFVTHEDRLLGLIFLATPVIRLTVRDNYLFTTSFRNNHPELVTYRSGVKAGKLGEEKIFDYGRATRRYMDMSVCVAAQPIAWHWNLGKLVAMLAPTLGDYVTARYPTDPFEGVTTTSLYGGQKATQYTRIYKYLGETEGFGSVAVSDEKMDELIQRARARCPNCNPNGTNLVSFDALIPKYPLIDGRVRKDLSPLPKTEWCVIPYCRWGDGANPRMRRIAALWKMFPEEKPAEGFKHGHKRGVYYHPAVPPTERPKVIQYWFERWGLPRYEKTKNLIPPYQNGLEEKQT